jgi:hypothetical protein
VYEAFRCQSPVERDRRFNARVSTFFNHKMRGGS